MGSHPIILPYLSGFVCASNLEALGSNPKHTIYAFFIYSILHNICHRFDKKRPGLVHIKKGLPNERPITSMNCFQENVYNGFEAALKASFFGLIMVSNFDGFIYTWSSLLVQIFLLVHTCAALCSTNHPQCEYSNCSWKVFLAKFCQFKNAASSSSQLPCTWKICANFISLSLH